VLVCHRRVARSGSLNELARRLSSRVDERHVWVFSEAKATRTSAGTLDPAVARRSRRRHRVVLRPRQRTPSIDLWRREDDESWQHAGRLSHWRLRAVRGVRLGKPRPNRSDRHEPGWRHRAHRARADHRVDHEWRHRVLGLSRILRCGERYLHRPRRAVGCHSGCGAFIRQYRNSQRWMGPWDRSEPIGGARRLDPAHRRSRAPIECPKTGSDVSGPGRWLAIGRRSWMATKRWPWMGRTRWPWMGRTRWPWLGWTTQRWTWSARTAKREPWMGRAAERWSRMGWTTWMGWATWMGTAPGPAAAAAAATAARRARGAGSTGGSTGRLAPAEHQTAEPRGLLSQDMTARCGRSDCHVPVKWALSDWMKPFNACGVYVRINARRYQ
jgi:hypothetical protein